MVHHRVAIGLGAADQGSQLMCPHSARRVFEDDGVMIGRQLDKFCESEAARFDRLDGLLRLNP